MTHHEDRFWGTLAIYSQEKKISPTEFLLWHLKDPKSMSGSFNDTMTLRTMWFSSNLTISKGIAVSNISNILWGRKLYVGLSYWYHQSQISPIIQIELSFSLTIILWTSQCRYPWRTIVTWDTFVHDFLGCLEDNSKIQLKQDPYQNVANIQRTYKLVVPQWRASHLQYAGRWGGFANFCVTMCFCMLSVTTLATV
jgi:hypothetical protein